MLQKFFWSINGKSCVGDAGKSPHLVYLKTVFGFKHLHQACTVWPKASQVPASEHPPKWPWVQVSSAVLWFPCQEQDREDGCSPLQSLLLRCSSARRDAWLQKSTLRLWSRVGGAWVAVHTRLLAQPSQKGSVLVCLPAPALECFPGPAYLHRDEGFKYRNQRKFSSF